jgi:hypothetical protein
MTTTSSVFFYIFCYIIICNNIGKNSFIIGYMITITLLYLIRIVSLESHRFFKFVFKSYKIAFLRKEIDIRKSMRLIVFFVKYAKFAKWPFFKEIKDIQIRNRYFLEYFYFNSLLLSNVSFINCKLNGSLFMKCSLENIVFHFF